MDRARERRDPVPRRHAADGEDGNRPSGDAPEDGHARLRTFAASRVFFPVAAAYAAIVLPLSVLPALGIGPVVPALASPVAHAHEMLFGFALAAVAGHQLGPVRVPALVAFVAMWALARLAYLLDPDSLIALAANATFALALAVRLVPRLVASIKKPRNLAMPVALTALCACAVALEAARRHAPGDAQAVVRTALAVFALLMLFIGGRLIAPAVAGQLYRQHANLRARVQPRLEAALIACMLVAVLASPFAARPAAAAIAAFALLVAGVLAGVRLARWQLWRVRRRPDLLCLGAGYAWLALGLAAWALALATGRHPFAALHLVTVGALGTLTLNVMALTIARLTRHDPARSSVPAWGTLLVACATLARAAADFGGIDRRTALALATVAWSAAFTLLFVRLARLRRRERPVE